MSDLRDRKSSFPLTGNVQNRNVRSTRAKKGVTFASSPPAVAPSPVVQPTPLATRVLRQVLPDVADMGLFVFEKEAPTSPGAFSSTSSISEAMTDADTSADLSMSNVSHSDCSAEASPEANLTNDNAHSPQTDDEEYANNVWRHRVRTGGTADGGSPAHAQLASAQHVRLINCSSPNLTRTARQIVQSAFGNDGAVGSASSSGSVSSGGDSACSPTESLTSAT